MTVPSDTRHVTGSGVLPAVSAGSNATPTTTMVPSGATATLRGVPSAPSAVGCHVAASVEDQNVGTPCIPGAGWPTATSPVVVVTTPWNVASGTSWCVHVVPSAEVQTSPPSPTATKPSGVAVMPDTAEGSGASQSTWLQAFPSELDQAPATGLFVFPWSVPTSPTLPSSACAMPVKNHALAKSLSLAPMVQAMGPPGPTTGDAEAAGDAPKWPVTRRAKDPGQPRAGHSRP